MSVEESIRLSNLFQNSLVHQHKGTHIFPANSDALQRLREFVDPILKKLQLETGRRADDSIVNISNNSKSNPYEISEEVEEELEGLKDIYDEDFEIVAENPPVIRIRVHATELESAPNSVYLKLSLNETYPDSEPDIEVLDLVSTCLYTSKQRDALIQHLKSVAKENVGQPMCCTLVSEAVDYIDSNELMQAGDEGNQEEVGENMEEDEKPHEPSQEEHVEWMRAAAKVAGEWGSRVENKEDLVFSMEAGKRHKGREWKYTIGLIGKPSVGKSMFFNASTIRAGSELAAAGDILYSLCSSVQTFAQQLLHTHSQPSSRT